MKKSLSKLYLMVAGILFLFALGSNKTEASHEIEKWQPPRDSFLYRRAHREGWEKSFEYTLEGYEKHVIKTVFKNSKVECPPKRSEYMINANLPEYQNQGMCYSAYVIYHRKRKGGLYEAISVRIFRDERLVGCSINLGAFKNGIPDSNWVFIPSSENHKIILAGKELEYWLVVNIALEKIFARYPINNSQSK